MDLFQNTLIIVFFGVLCIACMIVYLFCKRAVGGRYLDLMFSLEKENDHVYKLTPVQAKNHLIVTCSLDIIIPISYGISLGGLALQLSPTHSVLALLPVLLAVLFDYCENITIIIALKKREVPRLKLFFTVMKFIFFITAVGWVSCLALLCR